MTPDYFSVFWKAMASAVGNHLWQSTLFVIVAWVMTLLWRKNPAPTRYWLFFAASLKFLLPFGFLVGLGSRLAAPHAPAMQTGFYMAIDQVTQPFILPPLPSISPVAQPQIPAGRSDLLPMVLATTWFIGMMAVLLVWSVRWRRVSAVARNARPIGEGREVEALRRLENKAGIKRPLAIRVSKASLEPGVFGIFRPVLLWPEGISARLDDGHLEAILAHELAHLRRRDNLAAALHMAVEALFWFHPLVWWLGARLLEERESACDEAVLACGSEPQVYAESILKTCEFCLGSPVACVSGVTGADLKKRVVNIMTQTVTQKLGFSRKLLLSAGGVVTLALPVVFGLFNANSSRAQSTAQNAPATSFVYEVASIKPSKPDRSEAIRTRLFYSRDNMTATNITLRMLIREAYGVEDDQLSGSPGWLDSERYDIEAKVEPSVADQLRKIGPEAARVARQNMLQALLADRLNLKVHRDSKERSIYALVVAKNGPKLQEAKPGDTYPNGIKGPDGVGMAGIFRMGAGELTGQGVDITNLVGLLARRLGRTVVDKTGLTGKYDFALRWNPDDSQGFARDPAGAGADGSAPSDSSGPSIFAALQEQLGLKLESQKGPVMIIVIDHVEKPSEN